MLRNRSKISQNNHRNTRRRNRRNVDEPDEPSSSSNEFDSSQQDCSSEMLFDDSSDSWLEDDDDDVSPVIGRNLKTRRNRLNAKSKRNNKVINNRNRNSRSNKNSHRSSDIHAAGPSRINNNSRRSRSENSNARTAKRKFKDRREDSDSSLSEVCNTSSEELEGSFFRLKKKRPRHAFNLSESEDSDVQTVTSRRRNLLDSESSTSTSDEIITSGRTRRNPGVVPSWSDSSADSIELNSQETSTVESSGSSSFDISRRNRSNRSVEYVGTSDSSSSSSSFSNSIFSLDSEVANITSVLDSEASSSYNTAPSVSSSNVDNTNKDQTSDSDSSDSDGEKCAICLKKFRNQLIGNPSNCEHNFCAPCLKKWSESSTTCPVDRSTFDFITIRSEINGPVVDKFRVENRNFGVFPPLDIDEEFLTDAINCEICGSGDDEETLLLCDFCNLGYHMACLRPPLSAIPAGAWYCPPCVDLHSTPAQNVNEALRFFPNIAVGPLFFLSSARRTNRIGMNSSRSRLGGPLPRGRGPTRGFRSQNSSNSRLQNLSNVIESVMANLNVESTSQNRRRRKRRDGRATGANALQQVTTSENLVTTSDAKSRITRVVNQRMSSSSGIPNIPRPRGPRDVVDMVFPSFSLFGGDDLDYFSDGHDEHDVDGEVAIMARVRNEYSARRLGNRKNIVTSLNNYHDRGAAAASVDEITANASSANLLDSILESQTLWHSKNVEIKSKKDGTLEIKRKDERKPDLTNTNHSSKEIPLFPNKGDGASDNKSYSSSNNRYSSLGNSSGGGSNSFTSSTSSFNSLNPSTRPGFSNLLGNSSSALDLSPFRGAAPIRFRMNPPRPMMRRQNYNSNSQRPPSSSPASLSNSVQSPKKSATVGNAEEDVDLYDDIETENAENEKAQEIFGSLEPPPEPPALLIGNDSSSSDDENNGLVIDDKAVNKSNMYDPNEPNEDSDTENNQDKNSNLVPSYLRSPSYGGLSEFGPHLPLPEPPALPIELDSVKDSDEEEEAECPNMTLYSSTSINLANNVQDIPIPDAAYPQDELECIPIPTPAVDSNGGKEDTTAKNADSKLYSPTDRNDSETSSLADVEISSPRKVSSRRRDTSEIRSVSSRYSSREPSDRSSADESDRSDQYEKIEKRSSRRRSKDNYRTRRRSSVNNASVFDPESVKPSKEIDLTEIDSNDEKELIQSDDESIDDSKADADDIDDKYDVSTVAVDENNENEAEKSDNDDEAMEKSPADIASTKSINEDNKSDSDDENEKRDKDTMNEASKEKPVEDTSVDTSLEVEVAEKAPEDDNANATANDANASGNYLLPSEDLDPVSDIEYNDFSECPKSSSIRDKRKKRKKTRRRDSSTDNKTAAEAKELEEGEIEEEKSKRKYSSQKKKGRSETPERSPDRRLKKKRDRKEKTTGKENKESGTGGKTAGGAGGASVEDLQWKKLSKNTKERNYRDGKPKPNDKTDRVRDREIKSRKEKRKEIERYDVRKIVSDKPPRPVRDEFGRDVSVNRSRSRTRTRSLSYSGRKRSKGGTTRRSFSQDDRWIDWSPVWNQRRSRSRTRRTRSRSRNRSRLSGDRYRNRSKNREREYDKREPRKRKRSVSSDINKFTPPPAELKKRRRSRDRSRKSESYAAAALRPSEREREIPPEYYYERSRSWSRTLSYASLTPEPEQYVRYSRSPSIIEPPARIPLVSPDRDRGIAQNPQNLTVIVPNVDLSKKKHKKKKDSKKKKKKQPSKEVFTSGDNIVVSVNFDDNQKTISAKSSKRKHDDEKGRKKKETRKKRKQTLQVSDEVLNAKPVAVIDLNSSPCKEMSPTEVISLTDSGDEANVIIENVIPVDRRIVTSQEDANKSPKERRAYVMTLSGPKTPPEPPIKFTVNSTAASRPLPTNPIFEQDEIDGEDAMHYNKGPNTPPEPAGQTRRSISPSTTMYDPFEPTKSRSQSPENTKYDERKDTSGGVTAEERRPVIDMFSDDGDKPVGDSQGSGTSAEKSKPQDDIVKETSSSATPTKSSIADDVASSINTKSPAKDALASDSSKANETAQSNGVNTLVLDLSSLGDDFVPKSSIPLVKTSQGKYEFQSGKAPDKPITVVISQQSQPVKPQPQQVMVTPTRQIPPKPVEPMKQPVFPDLLSWKLPPPMSQTNFSTPPPTSSSLPPGILVTPSKSAPGMLAQNGNQDESSFEIDDSPYSPASSEGDDLFEPPPLNASTASPNKQRPSPMPAVNSFKSRVDALFSSSPMKKAPPRGNVPPHISKPVSAIKGTKKILKPPPPIPSSKKDIGSKADEEQLKILDDVPNSAVEMMVKEKFLKKLHRQERVVEEVKVVLKPHYAKKHITKEEYKDILRKAVPKICHNKSGDINPSKIQGLVEAYVKKIRYAKKKPTMGAGAPLFPPMKTAGKTKKPQKSLWG